MTVKKIVKNYIIYLIHWRTLNIETKKLNKSYEGYMWPMEEELYSIVNQLVKQAM